MALTNTYYDAYLFPLVTEEREARSVSDVALEGALPADFVTKLEVLRTYILVCQESSVSTDDLFTAKLKIYSKDYGDTLTKARAAQAALDASTGKGMGGFPFVISLERG